MSSSSVSITEKDFHNKNYDKLTDAQKAEGFKKFSRVLHYCTSSSDLMKMMIKDYTKACNDYLVSIGRTLQPGGGVATTTTSTAATTTLAPTIPYNAAVANATVMTPVVGRAGGVAMATKAAAAAVAGTATTTAGPTAQLIGQPVTAATTAFASLMSHGNFTTASGAALDCLHLHSINDCIDSQLKGSIGVTTAVPALSTPSAAAGVVCYDAYLCTSEQTAALGHHLLGPVGLVLCLAALFAQLVFLALFRFRSVRSPTSLYLSAMCLFDIVTCVLLGLLPVTHYLPRDTAIQKEVYHSFTVFLAPIGQPLLEWADLVSLYLLIVLFVQHRCGLSKLKFVTPTVLCVSGALMIYSIPKALRYWYSSDGQGRRALRLTSIGADGTYQKIEDQLLKVPVELFIPYLTIGGFACFRLYKRLDKYLLNKSIGRGRRSGEGPSATATMTAAATATSAAVHRDWQLRKDAANEDIVSLTGGLVFLCRFPNLVFHIVRSHGPAVRTRIELTFYVVSTFLLIACLLLKPAVYLSRGLQYRQQVRLFLASVCSGGGGSGGSGGIGGSDGCVSCSRGGGMDTGQDKDSRRCGCEGGGGGGSVVSVPMSVIHNYSRCSNQPSNCPATTRETQLLLASPGTSSTLTSCLPSDENATGALVPCPGGEDKDHLPAVVDLPSDDDEEEDLDDFKDALPGMADDEHRQHPQQQQQHSDRQRNSVSVSSDNAAFVSLENLPTA